MPLSPKSETAIAAACVPAKMERIVVHWTGGGHKASANDRAHYHLLIEADGNVVQGIPTIDLNQRPARKGYAAHTLRCNSGSIGVSLCCMAGAIEAPFHPGVAPMTKTQWDALPHVLAALCKFYQIPVTPQTVLSHAEVQPTLGIAQKQKWDITRLPFGPAVVGARAVGEIFRSSTKALLNLPKGD